MSYTYLQEQGEESLVESFSDIPQYVLSRLNLTAEKFCCNDSATESFQSSQSGTMSPHSTVGRGKEKLTLCAVDSHVKILAYAEKPKDSTQNGLDCGPRWPGSFAKLNRNTCLWKTHQCSLFEDLDESLQTWPRWGLMLDGECLVVHPWETWPRARDFGCSLMRPTASDGLRFRLKLKSLQARNNVHQDGNLTEQLARAYQVVNTPKCSEILMMWPETWSDLKPLEMDKYQHWLKSHGKY